MRYAILTAFLFLSCARAYAQAEISAKAYPPLPVENPIKNSGFELIYIYQHAPKIVRLTDWSQWPFESPWGFLTYPDDAAALDKENRCLGNASLRLRNAADGKPRALVQIVAGKNYTYQVPDAARMDEAPKDDAGKTLEDILPDDLQTPTHVLSFWAKTDGKVPGQVELFNITAPPNRKLVTSRQFTNTSWQAIFVPFVAPQQGSGLIVSLGLARSTPANATVWYDNVSLLPIQATLIYEVNLPALAEVTITAKTNHAVLKTSTKRSGSLNVPAQGAYIIEARDQKGEKISREYPDQSITSADSIVANGGFEQDPRIPLRWQKYDAPSTKFGPLPLPLEFSVDTNTFKVGRQSLRIRFSSQQTEALTQIIPSEKYLPGRKYVFSFWIKTGTNGSCTLYVDNMKDTTLVYTWPLADHPDWKYYRYEFTTPKDKSSDLMVLIMGPRDKAEPTTVWLDDIAVRPLQDSEKDAVDLLEGLEKDMTDFYRSVIREQIYDMETAIDRLGFTVEDFRKYGVIDNARYKDLRGQVDGMTQSWQTASKTMVAIYQDFLRDKESLIAEQKWAEAAGLAERVKSWRETWPQSAAVVFKPLQSAVDAFSAGIRKENELLIAARQQDENQIVAAEQKSVAEDYRKAMEAIQSPEPGQREQSALELGRLENPAAAPALIKLLNDQHYPVRRNALYALAWMRSSEAVPAIMALFENSSDPWTRRRATQALGMIGDSRAVPILKKLVEDPDGATRQNAILALGWLREPTAVDMLTRIVGEYLEKYYASAAAGAQPEQPAAVGGPALPQSEDGVLSSEEKTSAAPADKKPASDSDAASRAWSRDLSWNNPHYIAASAAQSLGMIGERSATPLLLKLAAKNYANNNMIIVQRAAIFALGQLGDKTAEPLLQERSKEHWARDAISMEALNARDVLASAGQPRPRGIQQPAFMTQKRYFYWLDNHFQRAFGRWFGEKNRPQDVTGALRYAGAIDANQFFEWSVPAPLSEGKRYFEAAHDNGIRCLLAEMFGGDFNKDNLCRVAHYYGGYPAFAGMWREEGPEKYLDDIRDARWGLNPELLDQVKDAYAIDPEFRSSHREFFARFAQALDRSFAEGLQENREFLHMLRKGTLMAYYTSVCSATFTPWIGLSLWGQMAQALDINGTEPSYCTATYENGMFVELCRDGGETCTGMEVYIWRLPRRYTRQWETGMCISLLHAQQFYVWYWGDIFKQLNNVERGRPEAWEITRRIFPKMKKLEPYLIHNQRPKDFALVHSGRTSGLLYRDDAKDRTGKETAVMNLYTRNNIGIYQALAYEHMQADVIWADTLTREKIKDYKVILLSDAKTLTPDEEAILREWVGNGGSLIVTGTTTLYDPYGNVKTNYGLADVFGVDFVTNTCTIPLENIDSGKGVAASNMDAFTLNGQKTTYDLSYGYDKISVNTAKVLAEWGGGKDAALTLNTFGKGHCLFVAATYPGVMYTPGRLIYRYPLFKNYFEGIPQLLSGLVRQGLSLTGTEPLLFVENCPWYVEANLRLQPENKRLLFQLLNYDEQKIPVQGVKARVRVPGNVSKVYYGADDLSLSFTQEKGYVSFPVRGFDIHEAIVIEY